MNRLRFATSVCGLACALGALACTKGGTNTNPHPTPSGTGAVGTGTGGVGGPPPPPPSGNVIVEIQEPMAGLVALTGSLFPVKVTARVDQGSDVIDPTTVKAVVMAMGDTAELESTTLAPQGNNVFSGRMSIGEHPSGDYVLTVSAVSSSGVKGSSDPFPFQIDAGPQLFVRTPQQLHSYKGLLVVEVVADPGMFGPLDGPHATVANYPVALDPVGDPALNIYRGMIDLDDPMPPNIVPRLVDQQLVSVWATDANGKRVDVHVVFVIDQEGPQITMTSPAPGEIVGDIMRIAATVSDPAGVLDSSVIAVIGDDTTPALFTVTLRPDGVGVYSLLFDTRKLTGCPDPPSVNDKCIVYPTISFRASDELGNERAVGYDFTVDNIAPVADLDPPLMRSWRLEDVYVCSWPFDPLSNNSAPGDMPGDRNIVPQVFDLRARIEDDGNHAPGLKGVPISLVDPDKTAVYVLDDELQALIVDTDGDGWCDAINPLLVPTTEPPITNNQVLKIRLAPVTPAGKANFTPDPSLPNGFCDLGTDAVLPPFLCSGNQPTVAIGYAGNGAQPAIWSLEDIDPAWCFGKQFDTYANNITDNSWACIAVQTSDFANNTGVSAPLRVYVQQANAIKPGTIGPGTPPACTGIYDRTSNTVTPGPCKTRRFADAYCYNRECGGPTLPP